MKIIALFAAGALAAGTLISASPADAQRHGWDGPRGGPRGDQRDGRGWDGPRGGGHHAMMAAVGTARATVIAAIEAIAADTAVITDIAGRAVTAGRASCAGSSGDITARFVAASAADTEP
jgi:hypothetical protein